MSGSCCGSRDCERSCSGNGWQWRSLNPLDSRGFQGRRLVLVELVDERVETVRAMETKEQLPDGVDHLLDDDDLAEDVELDRALLCRRRRVGR